MRGNLCVNHPQHGWDRSIPAYAGEPRASGLAPSWATVYPRVCGGTEILETVQKCPEGLSPRMRGNPTAPTQTHSSSRSIPAYAGEPPTHVQVWRDRAVYPRVCGGTWIPVDVGGESKGLSPRMRGNHGISAALAIPNRSIPAYAGEPRIT